MSELASSEIENVSCSRSLRSPTLLESEELRMPPFPLVWALRRSTYRIQSENSSFSVSSLAVLCSFSKNHPAVESIKRMCAECTFRPITKGSSSKRVKCGCKLLTVQGGAYTQEMSSLSSLDKEMIF